MAILGYHDRATEDIAYARVTKESLRRLPRVLHEKARIKLARLHAAGSMEDLAGLQGNRLEKLAGDRRGQFSIRLNDQYRICFIWTQLGPERVEIVDYH